MITLYRYNPLVLGELKNEIFRNAFKEAEIIFIDEFPEYPNRSVKRIEGWLNKLSNEGVRERDKNVNDIFSARPSLSELEEILSNSKKKVVVESVEVKYDDDLLVEDLTSFIHSLYNGRIEESLDSFERFFLKLAEEDIERDEKLSEDLAKMRGEKVIALVAAPRCINLMLKKRNCDFMQILSPYTKNIVFTLGDELARRFFVKRRLEEKDIERAMIAEYIPLFVSNFKGNPRNYVNFSRESRKFSRMLKDEDISNFFEYVRERAIFLRRSKSGAEREEAMKGAIRGWLLQKGFDFSTLEGQSYII